MKKALEILKIIANNKKDTEFKEKHKIKTEKDLVKHIYEVIKELEALEARSCESCKEYHNKCFYIGLICGDKSKEEMKSFYCNEWKSKC